MIFTITVLQTLFITTFVWWSKLINFIFKISFINKVLIKYGWLIYILRIIISPIRLFFYGFFWIFTIENVFNTWNNIRNFIWWWIWFIDFMNCSRFFLFTFFKFIFFSVLINIKPFINKFLVKSIFNFW